MNKKNIFISFEGPEASGKSSQLKELRKFLNKRKISFVITREPGGTKISEKLRKIILSKEYNISNHEELMLLMASRFNHINTVIKPALKKGKLVISDRFCDSTFVYQCYVNGFGINYGKILHKQLLDNFLPNDNKNLNFHNKIIKGYKIISKNNSRFVTINAEKKFDEIQIELQNKIIKIIS